MDQNFDWPLFHKFQTPSVGVCPTCLKFAGEALGLLDCVLKRHKILMKFNHRGPVGKNEPKFDRPPSPNLKPFELEVCPTRLKLAGKALDLLGFVLKRLKIFMKFNHHGPVGKNGPKF